MNSKFFLTNGYEKFKLNRKYLIEVKNTLIKKIKKKTKIKSINLDFFHKSYSINKINNLRLYLYKEINSDQKLQN